jgi:demethylmenaquinone methyltransferase/2-methoxy-6-polyprenyl-1,4-benzoquinol methylase
MTRRETRRSKNGDSKLLEQQLMYYRARAPEYDEWFLRQGRYDRGAQHRSEWFREVALIERELQHLVRGKDVLELAAGTGLWTKRVAHSAKRVLAIDGSPEVIGINRKRLRNSDVEYQIADIFTWQPRRTFDVVFFSFWLSHVPSQRFKAFWDTVRRALNPRGNAFFIDSLFEQTSTARDQAPLDRSGTVRRKLNDGRKFRIVKVFYEPANLERRLRELGWIGRIRASGKFFIYGSLRPTSPG